MRATYSARQAYGAGMTLTRRRFFACCAIAALNGAACSRQITKHQFRFYALGAEAQITLYGSRQQAENALLDCRNEIAAIESAFSLYDPDSMLSRLNRDGTVLMDTRFSTLLSHALHLAEVSSGAFDPTIQPLWQALSKGHDIKQGYQLVGWRDLVVRQGQAQFVRQGMAASFNGIAQGFAADRVSAILTKRGFKNILVNLGEFSAQGTKQGAPWRLGIRDPLSGRIATEIEPANNAIATSEPRGTLIAGRSHIFDPLERGGKRWVSVTVEAAEAWRADALSTAIAASPIEDAEKLLAAGNATRAWLINDSGILQII